jgi:cytochrome c oxidase assembly protein Cox11
MVDSTSSLAVSSCQNLDAGSTAKTLTVNNTWINQINPNIVATRTIAVQFNQNLSSGVAYSLQVITDNVLPAIGSITSNFELYTISGTGFMLEENWNFGQVYF